jgi:3',5'-cyclic AMP phosphodiesterase CpdA
MIIAQISDPHITRPGAELDRTYATAEHLRRAVDHLLRLPARPDLVLLTGDCVDAGSAEEYERLRELLSPLTMPVYAVPGNHDDRQRLREAFGAQGTRPMAEFVQYVVEDWPVRLIGLDTNVPGEPGGRLCAERLGWLADRLAEQPARPTVIFMHHPPFRTGLHVLDAMGLDGSEALGAVVARHPNVERVLAGHVHRLMQRRFHGSVAMTCPSTAHQVHLDLQRPQRLAVVMEPPTCLLHAWDERSGLVTHASPIGKHGPVEEVHDGEKWRS